MKIIMLTAICGSLVMNATAQIDNLVNVSANWIASPARNAATDAADIVFYNPSSTAEFEKGLHINIGNQSLFRKPTHTYDLGAGTKESGQIGSDAFLPNLFAAYTKNNWSLYTGFFISGGGATLNYPVGSITTDLIGYQSVASTMGAYNEANSQYLKASSYYMTGTFGAAYKFSNLISASLSIRYLNGSNKTQSGLTLTSSPLELPDMPLKLDYEESASGLGTVAGIAIHPSSKLLMTIRYETKVKMDFKSKVNTDDFGFITDGSKNRRDLPSTLAFGASYKITNKLTTLLDVNYYSQEKADWGTTGNAAGETVSLSKTAGDAITYCIAANYSINDKFAISAGVGYSDLKFNDIDAYYTHLGAFETVINDNVNYNIGANYKISKRVELVGGFMHTSWAKNTKVNALMVSPDTQVTLNNSMNAIAFGANINF